MACFLIEITFKANEGHRFPVAFTAPKRDYHWLNPLRSAVFNRITRMFFYFLYANS